MSQYFICEKSVDCRASQRTCTFSKRHIHNDVETTFGLSGWRCEVVNEWVKCVPVRKHTKIVLPKELFQIGE